MESYNPNSKEDKHTSLINIFPFEPLYNKPMQNEKEMNIDDSFCNIIENKIEDWPSFIRLK